MISYDDVRDNLLDNARKRSKWNWDTNASKDGDIIKLGKVIGVDWEQEIKNTTRFIPAGYNWHGDMNGFKAKKALAYMTEKADAGFTGDTQYYQATQNIPKILQKVAYSLEKALLLSDIFVRIHNQLPGNLTPLHCDTFQSYPPREKNPNLDLNSIIRFFVQLTDWQFGQMWMIGNSSWDHWKAGDIVYGDMLNIPHCTANAGNCPRYTMLLQGIISEKTMGLIELYSKEPYILNMEN